MEGNVLGTRKEISIASDGNSQISHVSQLRNPFLGLPLDFGPCESFCTSEAGKCEGHFGSVELPVPIYHPSHVTELKRMLSLVCLKLKKIKDVSAAQIPIREVKTADGACYLALKVPNSKMHVSFWSLLEKYGYHYEGDHARDLLLSEGSIFRMKDLPTENCQNHAVLIVGYGARRIRGRNIKFWKIQNSWGTTWADRGYGLISQVCESGEPVFSKFWFITDVRDVGL